MLSILISSLAGCAKKEEIPETTEVVNIRGKFDTLIPSLCLEEIGEVDECLTVIDRVLSEVDIPQPYSIFDNRYSGASQQLQFDVLDSANKIVHVDVRNSNIGVKVTYSWDTPEEDKEIIVRLLREMLGEDVYIVVEETYTDGIMAYAQGNKYRWKDGNLERVP